MTDENTTPNTDEQLGGAEPVANGGTDLSTTDAEGNLIAATPPVTIAPKTGFIAHLELYFAEAEHWTEEEVKKAIAWLESKKL